MIRSAVLRVKVDFGTAEIPAGYIIRIVPEGGERVGSWSGSAQLGPEHQREFQDVPPGRYTITGRPNPGSDDQETEGVLVELELATDIGRRSASGGGSAASMKWATCGSRSARKTRAIAGA